jgi:hypothetical protein
MGESICQTAPAAEVMCPSNLARTLIPSCRIAMARLQRAMGGAEKLKRRPSPSNAQVTRTNSSCLRSCRDKIAAAIADCRLAGLAIAACCRSIKAKTPHADPQRHREGMVPQGTHREVATRAPAGRSRWAFGDEPLANRSNGDPRRPLLYICGDRTVQSTVAGKVAYTSTARSVAARFAAASRPSLARRPRA